jgi:3-deoxy-7-phosphoheptulonate synthase
VDAIVSAEHPHCFLSVTKQGVSAIVSTKGNEGCLLILRGSTDGPNYSKEHVEQAWKTQQKAGIPNRIMIDCYHGNSHKDWTKQPTVAFSVAEQLAAGSDLIGAVMIESNICSGNQKCGPDMKYGVSITDACIDWNGTLGMFDTLAAGVRARRAKLSK